ncbi:MAG TPA: histidine phosphatase family protein [Syntrophales bacterium]|nr:MAG: phosphoglycerate mutase [Chloroflexi bacterium RBG_16_51_9]HLE18895.1 histidine phosphatase family protein [Syntrophales bacterium]
MKNIITIQHTQSLQHTNGMVGSWTDWELTDLGKKQAEHIGEKLSVELSGKNFTLYTSDLLRAKQTAEIVANYLNTKPIIRDVLRERNLGIAVGKSVQWLRENQECQEKTVDDRVFHDAESRRDVWNRLLPFYHEITANNEENTIIVSHGDTLSIFNAIWLGLNAEMLNQCGLSGMPGGVSFMLEDTDGKHIIRRLSDMSYMN